MKAQVSVTIGALVVLASCSDNPVAPKPTPTPSVIDVPAVCAFSVSPTTLSFGSNGGTQNVTLTASPAGCSPQTWTASSSGAGVTVSPTAGSGSATITLAASANTGAAMETSTATIAGQTVTATIDAAPPPPPRPTTRALNVTLMQGEALSGPYAGTVTGPNGFSCELRGQSQSCAPVQFNDGQVITLRVDLTVGVPGDRPIQRAVGCDVVTANSCTLTMTADRSVTISIGCAICAGAR